MKIKSSFIFLFVMLSFMIFYAKVPLAIDPNDAYIINADDTYNYDFKTYDDNGDEQFIIYVPIEAGSEAYNNIMNNTEDDAQNLILQPAVPVQTNATKYIALTFDDGPSPSLTPELLNALNMYNAKATFFLVGQMVANSPDIVKMIYNSGNEIGDHTYNHPDLTMLSTEDANWQITHTKDMIKSITGANPTLFRPPYGSYNGTIDTITCSNNLPIVLWNIDTLDWMYPDVNVVYNSIASNLQDGNIILLHDIHPTSVEAAIRILKDYSNKGYKFVTVSQLASIKCRALVPGQSYYNCQ